MPERRGQLQLREINQHLEARSDIPWMVKVVGMLQQNWAVALPCDAGVLVLFVHDRSGIFDQISFQGMQEALDALRKNGFSDHDPSDEPIITPPRLPLSNARHPNGPIYSSGAFWRS